MGTRAIISVEGMEDIVLYKHWDGYPSATLPWLEKFNEEYPRDDPHYKFAQLVRSSVADADEFNLDDSLETGWGVFPRDHIESVVDYDYVLKKDGRVTFRGDYREDYER